jgi:hypothetical protein
MAENLPVYNCKGCGAPCHWIQTERGNKTLVDSKPKKVFVPAVYKLIESHFATCPKADQFKKGGK